MKRFFLMLPLMVALPISGHAQSSYQMTELGAKATINSIEVEIQFYSPSIIRVLKSPEGKNFRKESLSVIKTPEKPTHGVRRVGDELMLESKDLVAILNLKSGRVSFRNPEGETLLTEKEFGATFTDFNDAGTPTFTVAQSFVLDPDEAIYGLGILQNGRMSQRNQEVRMVQGNTHDFVPFFQSIKGYGLFWDNYSPTIFRDNPEETSFTSEVGDLIDYYFMYGGNADGVIARMRDLTGQAPMFPLWTFGYWQSRERYTSQGELVGVVRKHRELGVPLDGIILDWQYWGNNYQWNAMEFLRPEFYDPQKMVNDVHGLNARMIISIWSSFGPMTKQYRELNARGMLLDFKTWPLGGSEQWPPNPDYPSGVRVYDAFDPAAREIYWRHLKQGLFSLGIDGWWMDSTEPDHLEFKPEDFDNMTYLGSFRRVRNAYPLMTVGGVYRNQRAVTSDKRVFILTRSAFAGQQRYGANVWSGDIVASWEVLRNQISSGLNFSLCGIPYFNTDIGGFFLFNHDNPLSNPDYRELYARWIQFGAFSTMMRSHGTHAPREIYQFGTRGEPVFDAIEKYINLRYLLLPYIYSTAWDVTANQSSMIRALVMDFAHDENAIDIDDQYMFGRSILVSPVTQGMYSMDGKEDFSVIGKRELYLPKGTDWIDFWTGERHAGGQFISREVPLDIIPLYVRAGSILPIGPRVQFAEEKRWDNLEIRVYDGADGEFILYEDEKDNYNYEKGYYSTITFSWDDDREILTISDRKGAFPGMLQERKFNIVRVSQSNGLGDGPTERFDEIVNYSGEEISICLK